MTTSNIAGAIDNLRRAIEKEAHEISEKENQKRKLEDELRQVDAEVNKLRSKHGNHERELAKLQQELQSLAGKKH